MAPKEEESTKFIEKDEPDTDEDVEDVPEVPPREPWIIEQVAQGTLILLLAASASPISQLTLAPVFGSIPSAVNHSMAIVATFLLGFWLHYFASSSEVRQSWLAANAREFLTVWPFWIPVVQSVMVPYTGYLGPIAGPIIEGLFSCHAIIVPSAFALADLYQSMKFGVRGGLFKTGVTLSCLLAMPFISLELSTTSWIKKFLQKYRSATPVHLQLALATSYFLVFISWTPIFSLTIPGILHTLFFNQHFTNFMVNDHLSAYNWTLIDRQWSNTGYISVLESSIEQYRIMRADHSLLGGEFYLTKERILGEGWKVNEPIYAVFEMLEAIRLIGTKPKIQDSQASALVVGLGIGTAPKSLISHGIDTTILELDPVVHDFATKYFSLPTNHTAILEDAVAWVNTTSTSPTKKYDYIIHDVFTGGVEPLPLFTTQFLSNLRSLLKPQGLIALNYAGDLSTPLTRLVLNTITSAFQGCRAFRDNPKEIQQTDSSDFANMVIFCRNTLGPIEFRKPVERDFLGSKSRSFYMVPKPELEIYLHKVEGQDVLGVEDVAKYGKEQQESAIRHWRIMRGVVPDAVWELW